MADTGQDKILSFDTIYTNNHIQKLKILSGYLDHQSQKKAAVYIKYLELQYALSLLKRSPHISLSDTPSESKLDICRICGEIIPFCNLKEQESLQNLQNMYKSIENMQEMMQTVEIMKDMMPEGFSADGDAYGFDLSQLLSIMGTDIPFPVGDAPSCKE